MTNRLLSLSLGITLLCNLSLQAGNGDPVRIGNVCDRPELLQADQITDVSARLIWADVGDEYQVELVEQGQSFTGVPTYFVSNDPPFDVSGLTPGRNYKFQVRTVCGGTEYSEWSTPRNFSTELNNRFPCPLNFDLRDTTCVSGGQFFRVHVDNAPGAALGTDVLVRGVRLMIEHPWRSDLGIWLNSPDGTRVQLVSGLNAGDKNIGDPSGTPCAQFVELTNDTTVALPLSAAAEQDNFTGFYLPVESLAAFHNGQDPNAVWQLEICDSKANDKGKLRLFQIVFERIDCPSIDSVAAFNITENAAQISWPDDFAGDSVAIEYGPVGFLPGENAAPGAGGTVVLLPQPVSLPITLSGLNTLQFYTVYVRRQCAPGLWSANSYGVEFFTNCPPTLLENPDTLDLCPLPCTDPCPLPGVWRNVPGDDYEWKVRTGPGMTYPVSGPAAGPEGSGNYFYFRNSCTFSGANGKKAFLRTRCIQVSAPSGQPCHFSFDQYMNTKTGQMSTLSLQASVNGGQTWTTVQTWSGNQGKQWHRRYVNLSAYDGQIVLFQFVATGVFGVYGDIALDNLTFYGSTLAGTPDYVFYRDADGDGFGNASISLIGCTPDLPPGYVDVAGDCNDNNNAIYPGATEILCNQVDENCNGMADDGFIATPAAAGQSTCSGGSVTLTAQGTATGQFFWFDSQSGGTLLDTGNALILNNLQNTRTVWLLDSLTGPSSGCASARVPVVATAYPTPRLGLNASPVICQGQSFNLNSLSVVDSANASGGITWHSALPPDFNNYLPMPVVAPSATKTYYVYSETAFGCNDVDSVTILVNPRPQAQIAEGDSLSFCKNRSLTLHAGATGGLSPLQFSWSNGLNFANIPVQTGNIGNVTKTYTVTVTDANGCTGTDQIKIHTLPNITQTALENVQDVSSCGGSDGSITLTPVNGQAPYQFAWSGPVTGSMSGVNGTITIPNLPQGGYRVTVTDASNGGCSMVLPQIVINAPGLSVEVDTIIHPSCPGVNNGQIVLNVNGIAPTFLWSNDQHTATATNLGPGEYTVLIFDGACSQELVGLEITAPPPIDIQLNAQENVSCFGGADGALDLAVFGATPPYDFLWTNDSASEDITGLVAGAYHANIFDANGCAFQSPPYLVAQPPLLSLQPLVTDNVDCFGESSGFLSVSASGGVQPYVFNWNNDAQTTAIGSLAAGNYSVTLTDHNGCTDTWSHTVTQPPALVMGNIIKSNPLCAGATDGYIDLVPSGGVSPYHYNWSTGLPADTTALLDERGVGAYAVTVTDANGCQLIQNNILLAAPQLLSLSLDSLVSVACYGEQTGLIEVSVTGAVGALETTWNFQPDDLVLSNALAGNYIVRVEDSRGCVISDTFAITQPSSPLSLLLLGYTDALCYGEPNGSISVRTVGGTPPYTYLWNNGATTESLPAIPAGQYLLTVTDAKGCTKVLGPVTVNQPPALLVSPTINNIPCFGNLTGSILLDVSGGVPPYTYYWNNNLVTEDIFDLAPNNYSVTVVDYTGCAQILNDLIVQDLGDNFSVLAVKVQPISCSGAHDGRIIVLTSSGTPPYQFAWSAPVGLHPNRPNPIDSAINLAGGYYSVTVTDAAGCTGASDIYLIEEAPPLSLFIGNATNVLCKGDSTGAIPASMSGGLPPYEFLWNSGQTTANIQQLPAGIYQLTATDYRGCTAISQPVEIEEPDGVLTVNLVQLTDDICGTGAGAIDIQMTGGTPPNQYLWSNGKITPDINGLSAGVYQLSVTDLHGCTAVSPPYLIEALSDPIGLSSIVINPVQCHGDSTGTIDVMASGGSPAYQYFWSNGQSGPVIQHIPAGTYLLTVTDQSGCSHDFGIGVSEPPALQATWESQPGPGGWTAVLHISGGAPPYEFLWNAAAGNQTDSIATGLSSGYYAATVTDAFDCILILNNIPVGMIGTHQPDADWQISVAPNPTGGMLFLSIQQAVPQDLTLEIWSDMGQMMLRRVVEEKTANLNIALDLSGRPAGVYRVLVRRSDGSLASQRIVKW